MNQKWLTIEPHRQDDGGVLLVIDIHGHFSTAAASDAPAAIAEAIADLLEGMADHVKHAAQDVLSDSGR